MIETLNSVSTPSYSDYVLRYLLQPIALEIFCSDGRNYLLAYPRKVRNVVFQKFTSVSKKLSDSGQDVKQSVAGYVILNTILFG